MTSEILLPEATYKNHARLLTAYLQAQGVSLGYMKALDAVAVQHGHPSWQHAKAKLDARPDVSKFATVLDHVFQAAVVKNGAEAACHQFMDSLLPPALAGRGTLTSLSNQKASSEQYQSSALTRGVHVSLHGVHCEATFECMFTVTADEILVQPLAGFCLYDDSRTPALEWYQLHSGDDITVSLGEPNWAEILTDSLARINVALMLFAALAQEHESLEDARAAMVELAE